MIDVAHRITEVLALGGTDPAVEQDGLWHLWSDLTDLGRALGATLDAAGLIAPGEKIGMLLRNRPALFAAILAVLQRSGCIVTINPMLPDRPLVEDIAALAPPVLIADAQDWARPELRAAAERIGALGLAVGYAPGGQPLVTRVTEPTASAKASPAPTIAIEMLTSGTTGAPKRVRLERAKLNRSLWTGSAYESNNPAQVTLTSTVNIHVTPLVHIGGIWSALYNLYNGRRLVLLDRFDPDRWHAAVKQYRPKLASLPPSALRMVLERDFPPEDFRGLIAIRTGTAPVDPAMIDAYQDRYGIAVLDAYGATEFAGGVAGWTMRDFRARWAAKRGSVGRANAGVELRVVDRDTFAPLPPGEEGLLEVKGEQIGADKGWARTTDLACIDEDGFLFIRGRADAVINRGGFKIAPEHVQAALAAHPAITEAAVVGLADPRLGQVPVAALQLVPGASYPDDDALKAFLRERLKPYEIPTAFRVVEALPRTPSMKVSQPAVRALFEEQ